MFDLNMDTADALALARLDRENQGPWEAEYCYGSEANLYQDYDKCKKNSGHINFIPVDKFSIEDLPEQYRDQDLMDYIRAVSDLTVRVTVMYISVRRPETTSVSNQLYPQYSSRGMRRVTVGIGSVSDMDVVNDQTCPCKECQNSSTPQRDFAKTDIQTATHIVFDDLEGEQITCHLFYDRGGIPEACKGVVTLTGMFCTWSDAGASLRRFMRHVVPYPRHAPGTETLSDMPAKRSTKRSNTHETTADLELQVETTNSRQTDIAVYSVAPPWM